MPRLSFEAIDAYLHEINLQVNKIVEAREEVYALQRIADYIPRDQDYNSVLVAAKAKMQAASDAIAAHLLTNPVEPPDPGGGG